MKLEEWDLVINDIRSSYITVTSGQNEIYQLKYVQAVAYKNAGYPEDTTEYPFVQIDATVYSITPTEAANVIISNHESWLITSQQIEQERLTVKMAIKNANSIAEVDEIFAVKYKEAHTSLGN